MARRQLEDRSTPVYVRDLTPIGENLAERRGSPYIEGDSTMPERTQRVIAPLPAASPEVGKWLWALEETRARTKRMIAGLTQEGLDALTDGFANAIGTLLYHIALIEADYLCIDVMGLDDYLPELKAIFPFPVRTDDDRLAVVSG